MCITLAALILTGCAAAPESVSAPTLSTPEPTATASPTTLPSAASTPAVALRCETLLVPGILAAFEQSGYALIPNFATEPTHDLHPFIAYGGVACMWGPNYATDVVSIFAKSPITNEQAAKEKEKLAVEGWLMNKDSAGETWSSPEGADMYVSAIRFTDDMWEYALSADQLGYIAN